MSYRPETILSGELSKDRGRKRNDRSDHYINDTGGVEDERIMDKRHQTLVFVEVKYRKDDKKGYPAQAVDQRKQQKIRKSAMIYLKKNHLSFEQPIRFDVVEILGKKIRVIKHAF